MNAGSVFPPSLSRSLMASKKREAPISEKQELKKLKVAAGDDVHEPKPNRHHRVFLNPADCNLDFNIEGNGLQGSALHNDGFAYCWSGARANVGITGGKYCFSCRIVSTQSVDMEDTPSNQQHVCRVGISRGDDTVGNLGETEHSFGFGGTGKFSSAGRFLDYGEKFMVGDTIVCSVNLEDKPLASIGFSKNGRWLGIAKQFDAGPKGLKVTDSPMGKLQWESALFPHLLLKNVVVEVQFSVEQGLIPEEGYRPWSSALEDGNAIVGPTFSNLQDCEIMMMVGLPASGKTTWAEKWLKEHPEKRYVLLGTNLVLEQMKVPGLLRKNNYGERFDRLMDRATAIFNTLLTRAAKTPRNYILDQTNVYKNARKRKLKPFADFQKIAVVIFPTPEELKLRAEKRFKEMGKEVPDEAVNEMLANYVLPMSKDMPGSDDYFDQVIFPEINRVESQRCLDEMKCDLTSTSNVNAKCKALPYSRENSAQAYTGRLLQNQGVSSVSSGTWKSSPSPLLPPPLNYDYRRHDQVNSTSQEAGLHGRIGSFYGSHQSNQNPFAPQDAPFETYSSYGYGASPYRSYGVDEPYPRPRSESRNFVPGRVYDPNYSSKVAPYSSSNSERAGIYESPVASARDTLAHNAYDIHSGYGYPGMPLRPDMQPPSGPAFLLSPAPAPYGSPYATPTTPRPYGNVRPDTQYSGAHPHLPHPRYY